MRCFSAVLLLSLTACWGGTAPIQQFDESNPYDLANEYSADNSGLGVVVLKNGQVVYERYTDGWGANEAAPIFSGTKSFCCALAAAAIQDGLLSGFDETVSSTITEWQSDPNKSAITVRQLMSMESGLDQGLDEFAAEYKNENQFVLSVASLSAPGSQFSYGEVNLTVFGELMRRKLLSLGQDPLAYLKQKILDPIGLSSTFWIRDLSGNPMLSFGAIVTAREWAKYGLFLQQGGVWNGQQLVPSASLAQCQSPSAALPAYGMTFWLNQPVTASQNQVVLATGAAPTFDEGGSTLLLDSAPSDLYAAVGIAGNRMYISPSLGMVAVRVANGSLDTAYKDARFLSRLLSLSGP
jgi:CubicO group peptidase (beta-lactamase class C family)